MEDETGSAKKKMVQTDFLHHKIAASVIPMFLLLWAIEDVIRLAIDPGKEARFTHFAFFIGVITLTFGTVYFIIGLGIVADLALGWSSRWWSLGMEDKNKTALHPGSSNALLIPLSPCVQSFCASCSGEAPCESQAARKDIGYIAATTITMIMLLWAMFTGLRLVTDSTRRDGRYNGLAFSIGVVTIVFGLVYFIIGLAILADLILHISDELRKNIEKKEYDIRIDGCIGV